MITLFEVTKRGSKEADRLSIINRTLHSVQAHLVSEIGELAEEVNIATGFSTKTQGSDGLVGEAVDIIQCALDFIHIVDPTITEAQLVEIMEKKQAKWLNNYYK